MVKLTPLPEVGYEAELLNLEVPGTVGLSEGATEAEAIENLRQQVAQYILELQAIDYIRIVRPGASTPCPYPLTGGKDAGRSSTGRSELSAWCPAWAGQPSGCAGWAGGWP